MTFMFLDINGMRLLPVYSQTILKLDYNKQKTDVILLNALNSYYFEIRNDEVLGLYSGIQWTFEFNFYQFEYQ